MKAMLGVALWLAASAPIFAQAPAAPQRIRGDVVAIDGLVLQMKARGGEALTIKLSDNYTVTAVIKADPRALAVGAFIGTASIPQADGTQAALEVLVLPEASRGSGEGHYPWDLQPGSMMTNATVAEIVAVNKARRLTLKYKDGEKIVIVPENTPIVTFEPGDRPMLQPGAHIMISASKQADGSLSASRVVVGKDGLVPPM